jgi:hypothetical protein
MRRTLLLYIFLALVGADYVSDKPRNPGEDLKAVAGTLAVFAADQAMEHRWDIYSALTGKEHFMKKNEENVDVLKQAAVDMGVGYSIRTAYTMFIDKGLWLVAAMVLGAAVGTDCFGYRKSKH